MVRLLVLVLSLLPVIATADTVRLAIVVGNNAGRGELPPLRYAESDAGKVARVLVELGDVAPEHLVLIQGRPVNEVEGAITRLRDEVQKIKAVPENRTVLIFYFSGHSDGEGIELGQQNLPYTRLKALLGGLGTDVRVMIVDACRSGAGFRQKGAKAADPFTIKLTDSLQATGDAFIASSADDEAALESNEVMGSIFTHNFVSGLRGAADASGDRLVTLGEAYRYAFDQTVARTAMLPVGVQHPSYDYRMSGQGELVLSSLVKPSAQLVLPKGTERAVITDVLRDQVIAEVPTGATRELAIPPGQYGLRLTREGQSWGGRITVIEGAHREVRWDELSPVTNAITVARKGGPGVVQSVVMDETFEQHHLVSVLGGVVPSVASTLGLQWQLRGAFEPRLGHGFVFAVMGSHSQLGTVAESDVEARAGWRFGWKLGPAWLGVGAEIGPALFWQQTTTSLGFGLAGVLAPRVMARLFVATSLALTLEGETAFTLVQGVGFAFRPSGTLGLAFAF